MSKILLLASCLALAGLCAVGAALWPSVVWAYGGVGCYLLFALGLSQLAPATLVISAPLLAMRLTELGAGVAIESGAYMPEMAARGMVTGAFSRLALVDILFFGAMMLVIEPVWRKLRSRLAALQPDPARLKWMWWALLAVLAAISAAVLLVGVKNGFPLIAGIDRFVYKRMLDSRAYNAFITNTQVFALVTGMFATIPRFRLGALLSMIWMTFILVLFAEKFTTHIWSWLTFIAPPALLYLARGGRISLKHLVGALAAIVLFTTPIVLIVYGGLADANLAVERLLSRCAAQGELWYMADLYFGHAFAWDAPALAADLKSWFVPAMQSADGIDERFGLYYVMVRFTPTELYHWTRYAQGGFIFALYPYLIMASGYVGLIAVVLASAAIMALYGLLIAASVSRTDVVSLAILGKLIVWYDAAVIQGWLYFIFGVKSLILLAAALLLPLLYRAMDGRPSPPTWAPAAPGPAADM